jgi:hypothetical protein
MNKSRNITVIIFSLIFLNPMQGERVKKGYCLFHIAALERGVPETGWQVDHIDRGILFSFSTNPY